jgi:uncharacterized protein YjbJ (UPF0337 family)
VAKTAQDKAGEGAGLVGDKAAEVAGTAKEQAGNVAGEATAQARDFVDELREQLQDQADFQTRRLADNVRKLSDELRVMGDSGGRDSSAAGVVRQVADGGRKVAARIEERGPDGLLGDLRDFARRRPGVFLAGAAVAGFALARAGKGVSAAGHDGAASDGRPVAAAGGPPDTGFEDPVHGYGQGRVPYGDQGYGRGPGYGEGGGYAGGTGYGERPGYADGPARTPTGGAAAPAPPGGPAARPGARRPMREG